MPPKPVTVGVLEAKTRLSELLTRVDQGEEIIITRRGRPVAKLGPASPDAMGERWRRAIANLGKAKLRLNPGEDPAKVIRELISAGRRF